MFSKLKEMAGGKADEMLEQQLPKVAQYFKEKVGPLTQETLKNDALMTQGLGTVYDALSLATPGLGLLVKREKFVEFCLTNRHRIPVG